MPCQHQQFRPRSLVEVVARRQSDGDLNRHLREFLDEFYIEQDSAQRQAMLDPEPELLADEKLNAYLGAAAEHLAHLYGLDVPPWCENSERFLHRAHFPCGLESLKATYIKESPSAFRRRMIFVEADPLYRPRKDHPNFGE